MEAKDRIILSLDTLNRQRAKNIVESTCDLVGYYSLGLSALLREGYDILAPFPKPVMLDLRLAHDSLTVAAILTEMGSRARFVTLSPFIGETALINAVKFAEEADILFCTPSTVLSVRDATALGHTPKIVEETTLKLVKHALHMGVSGILAEPKEIGFLRAELGETPQIVSTDLTSYSSVDPASAQSTAIAGANLVMVGQLITSSPEPAKAAHTLGILLQGGILSRKATHQSPPVSTPSHTQV